MEKILAYFAIKYKGDWDAIYKAINQKEKVDMEEVERVIKENGDDYVTLISDDYPSRLKTIYKPPFVLFYKGDLQVANTNNNSLAVIGSRENTSYGKNSTIDLVTGLVRNECIIVSGLAKGIDSIAHRACLENKGKTIAVLANGLGIYYPVENKELQDRIYKEGLVVSEYPHFMESSKENFPKRNRIVAGLSDGVVVTEAKRKSGTMITVNRALEMGKDVFCLPYLANKGSGCNFLIKEGARLVENCDDVLNEL